MILFDLAEDEAELEEAGELIHGANLDDILGQMDSQELEQLPDDLPAEALPEWLQEIQKGTGAESAAANLRERKDRSLDDLDERLLDLRERGLEMSAKVSEEPGSRERLSKVVPNIDEALSPIPMTPRESAIVTAPNISPEQAKRADMLQNLVGASLATDDEASFVPSEW